MTLNSQNAVLRDGVALLYLFCTGKGFDKQGELEIDKPLREISRKLCGADIFSKDFNFPTVRLKSIFSDISLAPSKSAPAVRLNAIPLKGDRIPSYDTPPEDGWRAKAAAEIEQNYDVIKDNPIALIVLLEKYASFIPIVEKESYDSISLYEHIKALCCLASAGESERPYLLVAADFSGIQNFIYTISSKGALKSLRARSFFLELLGNHIIYEILEAAGVSPANIVYSGGGGFCLLLPNTDQIKKHLQEVKSINNKWLLENLQGKVYLGMRWMELAQGDTLAPNFKSKWSEMGRLLEEDKQRKFSEMLSNIIEISQPKLSGDDECKICHRDDIDAKEMESFLDPDTGEKIPSCPLCLKLYLWGDDLTDYTYIIRESRPQRNSRYIELPSMKEPAYYRVSREPEKSSHLTMKWLKNDWDVNKYTEGKTASFLYADYVTQKTDGKATADFEYLANQSTGKKLIGALRMDADNLGLMFTRGIADDRFDLSHYSALSRQISLFFTIYVNVLCKAKNADPLDMMSRKPFEKHGRDVTVVYSGGDDLFIVGAWDQTIELSIDIARNFARYSGCNPDVGISGGVFLAKHDFPLYQIAHLSEKAEETAKHFPRECQGNECSKSFKDCIMYRDEGERCSRKNAGLLFYVPARIASGDTNQNAKVTTVLQWQDIDQRVVPFVRLFCALSKEGVSGHLEIEGLSRSFIRRLFELVDLWETEQELYLPLMHYVVTKVRKAISGKMQQPATQQAVEEIISTLLKPNQMEVLWVPLTWVDFLMREA
jgi:CRISPR-associated protein Csm1